MLTNELVHSLIQESHKEFVNITYTNMHIHGIQELFCIHMHANIQKGNPLVLQFYKSSGSVIKKLSWHHYLFKINNKTLKFYRSNKVRSILILIACHARMHAWMP